MSTLPTQSPETILDWRMTRLTFIPLSIICVPLILCFGILTIIKILMTDSFVHPYSILFLSVTVLYAVAIALRFRDFGASGFWALVPTTSIILLVVAPAIPSTPFLLLVYMNGLIVLPIIILFLMLTK